MHVPHTPMHVVAPTGAGRSGPRGGAAAGAGTRGSAGQCPRPVFCSAPWKGPSLLVAVSTGLRTSSVTCSDSEPLLLCAAGRPDPRPVPPRHSPENGGVQGRHAEPPARGYQGGGGGGGDGGRSFENYKGILLCDRPSEQKMVVGVTEQPFLPPGRPDRDLFGMGGRGEGCLGLQPSHERMNRNNVARQARMQNSRGTAPTALSKGRGCRVPSRASGAASARLGQAVCTPNTRRPQRRPRQQVGCAGGQGAPEQEGLLTFRPPHRRAPSARK
eukprot:TRINITY_DN1607_c0_g1_i10.p1 TRINITY_DN1607_c0_g1~~TRINITY_DN1607_c0_g1_i10.p1  ORF type:complete len:272 (+),score=11.53 TRINITY_DN1607_c0_g1_i10:384-1199(+)